MSPSEAISNHYAVTPSHLLEDIAPAVFSFLRWIIFPFLLDHSYHQTCYLKIVSFLDTIFLSNYSMSFFFFCRWQKLLVSSCLYLLLPLLSPAYSSHAPLLKVLLSSSSVTAVWPNATVTSLCLYSLTVSIWHSWSLFPNRNTLTGLPGHHSVLVTGSLFPFHWLFLQSVVFVDSSSLLWYLNVGVSPRYFVLLSHLY